MVHPIHDNVWAMSQECNLIYVMRCDLSIIRVERVSSFLTSDCYSYLDVICIHCICHCFYCIFHTVWMNKKIKLGYLIYACKFNVWEMHLVQLFYTLYTLTCKRWCLRRFKVTYVICYWSMILSPDVLSSLLPTKKQKPMSL